MSKLRDEQNQAIKDFIVAEVLTNMDRVDKFATKVDSWIQRFEAVRSIKGLSYGKDPDDYPKTEPWEGASDVGLPLEAIILRAIIARFIKTIFQKPICNVGGRAGQDQKSSKIVEEYNEYTLEDEMNFEREFLDVMMDVGLTGDGWGKLIEANEEYEWEETYWTLINPVTEQPILDPNTKNEYDDEWPDGYPKETYEEDVPQVDPVTGITPITKEITITKKDKTYFGTKLIPINPKDLIIPKGCDTYDVNEWPYVGHRFKKSWFWLKDREGKPEEGGYENIDKIRPENTSTPDVQVKETEKIELIEVWAKINLPQGKDKKKLREVIALVAKETQELLGWIYNPYRGKRMIFHWQIMPMSHRARGKSIPEFARGIRDLTDSLLNNMVDRDTINSHAPFVYDEESGFDPEIHQFGPAEFWGVNDKTRLGRLDMGDTTEFSSQWIIEFTLGMLQKLFGVTDYTTGNESNIASNKTARGIQAIIGEGNFSFDTMISILQMTNKKFFEANIMMHAKMMKEHGMEKRVFYVTESEDNPYREISKDTMSLKWNFMPRGTSVNDNIYRRKEDAILSYKTLSQEIFFSPELSPTTLSNRKVLVENMVNAMGIKGLKLPTPEELQQELIQMKVRVQEEMQKKQQLGQLKLIAKNKRGTPEGEAAKKALMDIEMSMGGQGGQGTNPQANKPQIP